LLLLLIAAESFTEAIATLDDLISDGDDSYAYSLRGRAFLEQGVDMDSAVCDFTRAIELDEALPETSDPQWKDSQKRSLAYLYSLRGEAHEKNGALEKARRDAEKSRELDPE
jgi:tetratricopeptide (TPR) repeat protein